MLNNRQQIRGQEENYFSFKRIGRKLAIREETVRDFSDVIHGMGAGIVSVLFGQIFGHLLQRGKQKINGRTLLMNYWSTRQTLRSTEYMLSVFTSKIILDEINAYFKFNLSEYRKGGIVGLFIYLLNRPLDQLQIAKHKIFANQNKRIGRIEAFRIILKYDGFKGFYKYQNLIAPLSSYLYRSVFFGLYHKLSRYSNHPLNLYLTFPLLTALSAFGSTFLLDTCRTIYFNINKARDQAIQKRSKKDLKQMMVATEQFFNYLSKADFKDIKISPSNLILGIIKNSIFLSLFALSQSTIITSLFSLQPNSLVSQTL